MSRVFSMEPEGITRAWPMVPLISMKARATQNQAMISRWTRWPTGRFASVSFSLVLASAFMFHRYGTFGCGVVALIAVRRVIRFAIRAAFADFQLHQVRGIDACVTRRTVAASGVVHGLLQIGERDV